MKASITYFLTLLIWFGFIIVMPAQDSLNTESKYRLNFHLGLQEHDTRLFAYPITRGIDRSRGLGTYYIALSVQRKIELTKGYGMSVGLGWALEVNNWSRPYDPCYNIDLATTSCSFNLFELRSIDHYFIHQLHAPISFSHQLGKSPSKGLVLGMSITPSFSITKRIQNHGKTFVGFDFYSLENYMDVGYKLNTRTTISGQFRIYKIRAIDRLWWDRLRGLQDNSPHLLQTVDTHNPFKFVLLVSHLI